MHAVLQVRQQHVCAASVGPENPPSAVTALQGPGASGPAAYLVGVGPDGAAAAGQQVRVPLNALGTRTCSNAQVRL